MKPKFSHKRNLDSTYTELGKFSEEGRARSAGKGWEEPFNTGNRAGRWVRDVSSQQCPLSHCLCFLILFAEVTLGDPNLGQFSTMLLWDPRQKTGCLHLLWLKDQFIKVSSKDSQLLVKATHGTTSLSFISSQFG